MLSQDHHDTPGLHLELEPGPSAPAEARAAIAAFSETHGLDIDTLATVMLLVSELVTNAVLHPDVDPPAEISLLARLAGTMIRVEITDQGAGFTPATRPDADRRRIWPLPSGPSGRALGDRAPRRHHRMV